MTGGVPTAPTSGADAAAVERARADSVRHPYTVADIRFMSNMIGHHGQALTMSRLAPTNGASTSIRRLAERIINAQQDEITIMQQWLSERRQPVPRPDAKPMAMTSAEHAMAGHDMTAHHPQMPGMLTPAQLAELERARGSEFDRLFLTLMIQHHRGAIEMVRELFATPGAAQDLKVFKVANEVHVDQVTEVDRMGKMLSALIFTRPPQ